MELLVEVGTGLVAGCGWESRLRRHPGKRGQRRGRPWSGRHLGSSLGRGGHSGRRLGQAVRHGGQLGVFGGAGGH